MAKPNYAFEKRQRELAKKRKKEEKKATRKTVPGEAEGQELQQSAPADDTPPPAAPAP